MFKIHCHSHPISTGKGTNFFFFHFFYYIILANFVPYSLLHSSIYKSTCEIIFFVLKKKKIENIFLFNKLKLIFLKRRRLVNVNIEILKKKDVVVKNN